MPASRTRVHFDARWILVEDRFDGVSRYSHELAHALARRNDLELVWIVHDPRQLEKLPAGAHVLANDPNDGLRELRLPRTLNRAGARIVYSPFFVMGTLGKHYALALTIHDLIYFTHRTPPQWLPWHVRLGWRLFHLTYWPMRWQLNRAHHVATVSDTAKRALLRARATRREISTVPNAPSESFQREARSHADSNEVLYMGAFTPYKNVECLIRGVSLVPDITLHLCGKIPEGRRSSLQNSIDDAGVTDRVVLHDGVSDAAYVELLDRCRAALSASRLEGFGLPLIESQQAGTPFVAADTEIFREVGGESVLTFDPDDPSQVAQHLRALADPETNLRYSKLGLENAKRYSWDVSAERAAAVIADLVRGSAARE